MEIQLDSRAVRAVEAILRRGNNAIVRRKGEQVIVLEEKRKTVYDPCRMGGREEQSELIDKK